MLEFAIPALLNADPTVSGMVAGRIRPLVGAQLDARPLILFSVTAGQSTATYQGPSTYQKANVEIAIYGDTFADCVALSDRCRALMDGLTFQAGGVRVAPSMLDDESDVEAVIDPGKDARIYLRTQQYRMLYRPLS